jgi:polyphosphate kinase
MIRYLRDDVLATYMIDNVRARRMLSDGTYERLKPRPKEKPIDSQAWLLERHLHAGRG